jgi:hypothetical protein
MASNGVENVKAVANDIVELSKGFEGFTEKALLEQIAAAMYLMNIRLAHLQLLLGDTNSALWTEVRLLHQQIGGDITESAKFVQQAIAQDPMHHHVQSIAEDLSELRNSLTPTKSDDS